MINFMKTKTGPELIRTLWNKLGSLPGGPATVSTILGRAIPYSGSISPRIVRLGKGIAEITMQDRHRVRNHLNCVHAIALANLAEYATGLAINYSIPENARAILTGIQIQYLKKARGKLTAVSEFTLTFSAVVQPTHVEVPGVITDEKGVVVVRATANWLVSPNK